MKENSQAEKDNIKDESGEKKKLSSIPILGMETFGIELETNTKEKLRFQSNFLNQVKDAIIAIDNKERVTYLNQAAAEQYNINPVEALGSKLTELYQYSWLKPEDEQAAYASLAEKGYWIGENIHIKKNGDEIFVESTVSVLKDDSGKNIGTLAVIRDITERKRIDESLRETNQLLETILDSTDTLVAYLDTQFNFVRVNRAYAKADEQEPFFFPGKNHFDLYPSKENEKIFRRVVETGESYIAYAKPFEYAEHPERGMTYWDWSLVPVKDSAGVVAGLVLTIMDVTERQREKEELGKHREYLEELVEERTEKISKVNEQLRMEIEERNRTEEQQQMTLKILQTLNSAKKQADMLNDIIRIMEEELQKSEVRLAEAQRIAHIGIWELDLISNALTWSDEVYRIFGMEPKRFGATYEAFLDNIHPDDREMVDKAYTESVKNRIPYEMVHRLLLQDGTIKYVSERCESFYDGDGKPIRSIGTVQDITERKLTEEAKIAAERELKKQRTLSIRSDRLRSLGQMAAGIAHELNQPLVGVRGLAEHILIALERGWELTQEKLKERLTTIVEQADRMSHIIDHVRMFAREAGKPELQSVQVNEVVRAAMSMLSAQFKSRGLELECELAEDLPDVLANPFSLEEVILNLIINARDAVEERLEMNSSTAPSRVLLRTFLEKEKEERLKIEVIDWGIGIPEDILPNVFDPFFTTKEPNQGTGLGLSISQSIIEQFSGTMDIQSKLGHGTTVTISLPPEQ